MPPKQITNTNVNTTTNSLQHELENTLQPLLQSLLDKRDATYERISRYLELRNQILLLQENKMDEKVKTLIDLGGHCYVQAEIPDATYVYVNCGLGFHVQMTQSEAISFISKMDQDLQNTADQLTTRANYVKENIQYLLTYMNTTQSKNT
ncbi:hypothetical protein AKO1_006232 [Acrasis kona]|uniref:Uncharacterized protein n=1 Tax=Acrasis kona TaxID=1008807 RepID=A0AAW2YGY4_9EUKA